MGVRIEACGEAGQSNITVLNWLRREAGYRGDSNLTITLEWETRPEKDETATNG